jgi:hypothetical protein
MSYDEKHPWQLGANQFKRTAKTTKTYKKTTRKFNPDNGGFTVSSLEYEEVETYGGVPLDTTERFTQGPLDEFAVDSDTVVLSADFPEDLDEIFVDKETDLKELEYRFDKKGNRITDKEILSKMAEKEQEDAALATVSPIAEAYYYKARGRSFQMYEFEKTIEKRLKDARDSREKARLKDPDSAAAKTKITIKLIKTIVHNADLQLSGKKAYGIYNDTTREVAWRVAATLACNRGLDLNKLYVVATRKLPFPRDEKSQKLRDKLFEQQEKAKAVIAELECEVKNARPHARKLGKGFLLRYRRDKTLRTVSYETVAYSEQGVDILDAPNADTINKAPNKSYIDKKQDTDDDLDYDAPVHELAMRYLRYPPHKRDPKTIDEMFYGLRMTGDEYTLKKIINSLYTAEYKDRATEELKAIHRANKKRRKTASPKKQPHTTK